MMYLSEFGWSKAHEGHTKDVISAGVWGRGVHFQASTELVGQTSTGRVVLFHGKGYPLPGLSKKLLGMVTFTNVHYKFVRLHSQMFATSL